MAENEEDRQVLEQAQARLEEKRAELARLRAAGEFREVLRAAVPRRPGKETDPAGGRVGAREE